MLLQPIAKPLFGLLFMMGITVADVCAGEGAVRAEARGVVNCYDQTRNMVSISRRADCQGEIVSDAKAAEIRQRRRAYVKGSLEESLSPGVFGRHFAGVGSSFFVDRQGRLLTNAHVVKGCTTLTVSYGGRSKQPAQLQDMDLSLDLALVETRLRPQSHATFASIDQPLPKQIAIIGYPSKGLPTERPTLIRGSIDTSGTRAPRPGLLVLKAAVRPGNSGGPVLDDSGRVLGVVFAALDTKRTYEKTGQVIRDIGYAIPNRAAQIFLKRNAIKFETSRSPQDGARDRADHAEDYMARIECWL